ncbi:LysR family transcriptional regulator [Variovorax humicola]|uniref:LysR family transcriptional regulator n=1 Tax=Variovorax humicola TaxID=1769758 RepID=A0ABU8W4Y1_9BURK
MTIRFTLRQLQYFVTVARTGQISSAAAESNVTQSTMTAAIAELEKALDTLLFERARTGVTLTYHGHLFLQHATAVLEAAADAARHPFRERSGVAGTIELAASYTVLGYFLLPHIAKFQKQNPGVRVIPVERDRSQIESTVGTGETELAVALISNLIEPKRFHRHALARSRRQLWVADGHPLADTPQVSLQDVAPFPYILPMVDEGELSALRYWSDAGIKPSCLLRTSSMEAVREMVALGLGVTILSDMVFRPWSLDGRRIRTVPLASPIPPMEVGLIWLKGRKLDPIADAFRKYLEVSVRQHGGA